MLDKFPGHEFVSIGSDMTVAYYLSLDGDAAKRLELPDLLELLPERPFDKPICVTCNATRWWQLPGSSGGPVTCIRCRGLGWEFNSHSCTECGGSGCKDCRGGGWVRNDKR